MSKQYKGFQTRLIHKGEPVPKANGALVQPIYQTAAFEIEYGDKNKVRYIRYNNSPGTEALNEKMASLENAEAAMVCASGMAAISGALFACLNSGDHILFHYSLYGGTNDLVTKDFPRMGIEYSFIDTRYPGDWEKQLKPNTKAIYVESMTNPTLEVPDLKAVVEFAREHNLISMIDNTFASPMNFRPPEIGFDLSLHSATKYLNGHGDLVAGVVIGSEKYLDKITPYLKNTGGCLDPHAVFLLHRGVKTLSLRMKQHNENAMKLAEFLSQHSLVESINYPGLADDENHERARAVFDGFGGMMSFTPKGDQRRALQIMKRLQLASDAPTLGSVQTLVSLPALASHKGMSAEERAKAGISDSLIRVSVGIEHHDDLIEDFRQALESSE